MIRYSCIWRAQATQPALDKALYLCSPSCTCFILASILRAVQHACFTADGVSPVRSLARQQITRIGHLAQLRGGQITRPHPLDVNPLVSNQGLPCLVVTCYSCSGVATLLVMVLIDVTKGFVT